MPQNRGMAARYEEDLYAWSQETARAISEGRWQDVDLCHVADEISGVGKSEQRGLASQLERIMLHLLKMRHQPGLHTRNWDLGVAEARTRAEQKLRESPSLEPRLSELLANAYELARLKAARLTGLPLEAFPQTCPFSLKEVMGR
jgi:Domain of unknown function DUF29